MYFLQTIVNIPSGHSFLRKKIEIVLQASYISQSPVYMTHTQKSRLIHFNDIPQ